MVRQAVDRLTGLIAVENMFIITHREQREAVMKACPQIRPERIIGEPEVRNTAASIGLAMVLIRREDPEAVFAVMPADHVIHDTQRFQSTINVAFEVAVQKDILVTIGIPPTEPATAYGYIQRGPLYMEQEGRSVYRVDRFVEKPDLATAQRYRETGKYYWNAGIFIWRAAAIEAAFISLAPRWHRGFMLIDKELEAGKPLAVLLESVYPKLENLSIDYAIMEKASNVVMLPAAFDWDDVGSWTAVARYFPADAAHNVVRGTTLISQGRNNIVLGEDERLIALMGVDDLMVIQMEDALLICPKEKAQEVKQLTQQISHDPRYKRWS